MNEIYVIGHHNPDTDSIVSAMAFLKGGVNSLKMTSSVLRSRFMDWRRS